MECQYVATQRGGVALVFEGHRYNKVRDGKDGTVYWRCSRDRQCPGRAVTVNSRVKKANNKHNHPPEAGVRNGALGSFVGGGTGGSVTSAGSTGSASTHSTASSVGGHHPLSASVLHQQAAAAAASVAQHEAPPHYRHHQHYNQLHQNNNNNITNNSSKSSQLNSNHISHHHSNHNNQRLPSSSPPSMQDRAYAQNAAALAAVSFPAIVTETLKYLAVASGNPQMAAAFASSMASLAGVTGAAGVPLSLGYRPDSSSPPVISNNSSSLSMRNLDHASRDGHSAMDLALMPRMSPSSAYFTAAATTGLILVEHSAQFVEQTPNSLVVFRQKIS